MNNFKATHFLEVPQQLQIHFLFFFCTDNVVVVEMLLIFYQSRNVVSSPTVQQNQSSQACKVCQVAIISSAHYTLCSPPQCGPYHHHTTGSSWENMLLRLLPSSSLPHPQYRVDKQNLITYNEECMYDPLPFIAMDPMIKVSIPSFSYPVPLTISIYQKRLVFYYLLMECLDTEIQ